MNRRFLGPTGVVVAAASLLLLTGCQWLWRPVATEAAPLAVVSQVDMGRYQGLWYEIARFPNQFQKRCMADVTALYEPLPDGLRVTNRCQVEGSRYEEAIGHAKVVDITSRAKFKVRFAPDWLGWLPMVWGDYWIVDLDTEYRWVAISTPDREYLWILARQPQLEASVYQALLQRLSAQGLSVQQLVKTTQSPPVAVPHKS